jgi:hypothetical protein
MMQQYYSTSMFNSEFIINHCLDSMTVRSIAENWVKLNIRSLFSPSVTVSDQLVSAIIDVLKVITSKFNCNKDVVEFFDYINIAPPMPESMRTGYYSSLFLRKEEDLSFAVGEVMKRIYRKDKYDFDEVCKSVLNVINEESEC